MTDVGIDAETIIPPPEPAPPVVDDRPSWCMKCGYSLRGLDKQGRCPECGRSVRESLEHPLSGLSGADMKAVVWCSWWGLASVPLSAGCIVACFLVLAAGGSGDAELRAATAICHWKAVTIALRLGPPLARWTETIEPKLWAEAAAAGGLFCLGLAVVVATLGNALALLFSRLTVR